MRLQVALPTLLTVLFVVGCGSSSSSGGADPAASMPAGTPVYFEASLEPDGSQGAAARALLKRFLPPGKTLTELIDDASREQGDKTVFSKDVQPWLGQRLGVGVSRLTADEPSVFGAVGVTNTDDALSFLAKEGRRKGSYDGVDLYLDDDTWGAVRDDVLVFAQSRADLEEALDAQGGKTLSGSKAFEDALDDLPDERLGTLYVDAESIRKAALAQPDVDASDRALLEQVLGKGKLEPITGALTATDHSATLETRLRSGALAKLSSFGLLGGGASTDLVRDAPGDAFAVFGAKDVGGSVQDAVTKYAGALGGAALSSQAASLGLDLQRDLYSWVGDVAVYARGTSVDALNGAVVIAVKDRAAATAALPRLAAAARRSGAPVTSASVKGADLAFSIPADGAPGPVVVAQGGDRVVAAFGTTAAARALAPSTTLADSGRYDAAKDAVDGALPTLVVSIPQVLRLADSAGADDPDYRSAKPYLEKLDQVVTGSEKDGGTSRSLLTVTTK